MKIRKYIISDGKLIHGLVEFHNELTKKNPNGVVTGGGIVHFDPESKRLYLYSSSYEFGMPDREIVKKAVSDANDFVKHVDVYFSTFESLQSAMTGSEKIRSRDGSPEKSDPVDIANETESVPSQNIDGLIHSLNNKLQPFWALSQLICLDEATRKRLEPDNFEELLLKQATLCEKSKVDIKEIIRKLSLLNC